MIGAFALAVAGCGDDGGSTGSGTGSGTGTTAGPGGTEATEGPGATAGPGFTETSATDTAMAPTDDTAGDTTAGGVCQEPPEGEACQPSGSTSIGWQVRIDGRELLEQEVTGACTVADVIDDGTITTLALDCARLQAEIDLVTMMPHHVPALYVGDEVELHAWSEPEDEANVARYLTLRRAGVLALGAFDASEFDPPAGFDFAPVSLAVVATDCPQEPTECVYRQDAALSVGFDGQTGLLFQGQDATVGLLTSYRVMTGRVERIQCLPDCGYNYAEWAVQGLVFLVPEG